MDWSIEAESHLWNKLTPFLRVSDIEQKIGAGLIEEIIQVAEAELKLTDELYKAKV